MVRIRHLSIDAFRVVANLVVIWVHTRPFMSPKFDADVRLLGELLNQFVRIATPFFFMAAGYFFAVSLAHGAQAVELATRLIKRLGLFFVFWSLVYIFVPLDVLLRAPEAGYWGAVHTMVAHSLSPQLLANGSRVHLWFLPALGCALALLAAACRLRCERGLFFVAAALYLIGLVAGAYKFTPLGFNLGFSTRNGPFFSTIFVVTGFMIHRLGVAVSLRRASALIAAGVALRAVELLWITSHSDVLPSQIDYLLGTYPFGVGIFFLLLKSERLGKVHWMVKLSRYSGGIYCAHMLFVDCFSARSWGLEGALWEIARPLAILGLTVALVVSMSKVPALRRVVT